MIMSVVIEEDSYLFKTVFENNFTLAYMEEGKGVKFKTKTLSHRNIKSSTSPVWIRQQSCVLQYALSKV